MAIEIIPKPKTKKARLSNVFLYVLLIIFLAFLISYLFLYFSQKKLTRELPTIESSIQKSDSERALEEELLGYQKKVGDFGILLGQHVFCAKLFDYLEKLSHPKVWFSKFRLDSENRTIDLSGEVDNFEILGQQILIFKTEKLIKNINLLKVSITKEGKVGFDLQLAFDPKIFK
jgi:hypothetical protein